MMYSLIALTVIMGPQIELPPDEISRRFDAGCVDGRWEEDCVALRSRLELELYGDLNTLAVAKQPIERDALIVAANGSFPPLVEFGLRRLGRIESPAERETVLAAIGHPSPVVRDTARNLLESADPQGAQSYTRWWRSSGRRGWDGLVPDTTPMPEQLGIRDLADLRYQYFASDAHRAVFTSGLPPDQLLGKIAPGTKVKTGQQVAASADKQKQVSAGTDAAASALEDTLARSGLGALAGLAKRTSKKVKTGDDAKPTRNFEPVAEFADPATVLYVQIDRPGTGTPVQAAVGRDDGLGETVLVIQY